MNRITNHLQQNYLQDMLKLTSKLVSIKSITGAESTVINYVKKTMVSLGFENVTIDNFGNVFGKLGNGSKIIVFDSHLDTVEAGIVSDWDNDPFSGLIIDEKIYGRGSADMKGGFVSSLYGVLTARDLGLLDDCTAYVVGSIMEEDYEGEALSYLLKTHIPKCDGVIICEPSSLKIARGHKGRALIEVNTLGVSAHGSSPVHGKNAIYPMLPILNRIKEIENISCNNPQSGTMALTKISVDSVSYNAIPASCTLWLDRRIVFGETREDIIKQMNTIVTGTDAKWKFAVHTKETWTGKKFSSEILYPAWEFQVDNPIIKKMGSSYKTIIGKDADIILWNFSTNGVASAGILKIPTVGIGPGNPEIAHKINEYCDISELLKASAIYCEFLGSFSK